MKIYQEAANRAQLENVEQVSEKRLWTAVLLQALEDWQSSNMRRKQEADKFFFQSHDDFSRVCRGAGLVPESVLGRLRRMKTVAVQRPVLQAA